MRRALAALTALPLMFAACGGDDASTAAPVANAPHALPNFEDGKADNYVSSNAREYLLKGAAHVDLPADFDTLDNAAKASSLDRLVQSRLNSVARNVRSHVDGVIRGVNDDADAHDIEYFTFYKRDANTAEPAVILEGGTRARFDFEIELVGSYYLMSKIAPEQSSTRRFDLTVDGEDAPISIVVEGTASRDAFPKYDELFADGVYDIGLHFGGDYNEGRFDLETAKWTVQTLLDGGWTNDAVTGFDDLYIDSPPFTRQMLIEGKVVEARITIVHSDMVEPSEESKLSDAMKASFAEKDVVIYSGHAGPGAGFILDYQPRHEIPTRDFATLDLPEKYQIYVFDGCQTYRTYVDDILTNPAKTFDNLDIVTTVNTTPFSVGYQTIWEFVYWLTLTDEAGNHFPISWKDLLRGLNTKNFADVYYGVHGIDGDPQLNPHAPDVACQPCAQDADCGAGGNFCLGYSGGAACGVACTTDTACGDGYRCGRINSDPEAWHVPKQCIRRDYTCPSAAQ
ncbi:MAG: hypothetical protein ACI9U2_000125 [Bradymonadia bacterium]|jgi:hypothetical protein